MNTNNADIEVNNVDQSIDDSHINTESDIPLWSISTYKLTEVTSPSNTQSIFLSHPNRLGIHPDGSSDNKSAERDRLRRFRSRYISKELHDAAAGHTDHFAARRFRHSASQQFLVQCQEKDCFLRDDLQQSSLFTDTSKERNQNFDGLSMRSCALRSQYNVECVNSTQKFICNDIELGFSKVFSVSDFDTAETLPRVRDVVDTEEISPKDSNLNVNDKNLRNVLSVVISYRHTTKERGYMLNIELEKWPSVITTVLQLCKETGHSHFRLWTDQILSSRKPAEDLRWVSSGVLPYLLYPVLYIFQNPLQTFHDLRRMWISIEHLSASLGQGLIISGSCLPDEQIPFEWPTTYIESDDRSVTWMTGLSMPLQYGVRKLASSLMCGIVRNKAMSWADDAHDLIDWACAVSSSSLNNDLQHSFSCIHCKQPYGYTSMHRFVTLIGSSAILLLETVNSDKITNVMHPRIDVPAVELQFGTDGRTWDGFREWVPESCLWGLPEDEIKRTRKRVVDAQQALVFVREADDNSRALSIVQFTYKISKAPAAMAVAYLLVGLVNVDLKKVRNASVKWSKRFWPLNPSVMFHLFQRLWKNGFDREALLDISYMAGACSRIDHNDISRSSHFVRLRGHQIKWK